MKTDCTKCEMFNKAAIENGYAVGVCEECFNKAFVLLNLAYNPYDGTCNDKGPKIIIQTCGDWE